jgi:periplasmic protein TonB
MGRVALATLATLAIHGVVVTGLVAIEPDDEEGTIEVVAEFEMDEIVQEAEPPPAPEPVPEPEPEAEPEPKAEREPEPEPEPEEPRPAPPPDPAPPPPGDTGDPAPGWAAEAPSQDQPYNLGDAVPAAQARAPAARGRGGTGGGTGTGGGGETNGTGSVPTPVSVSDIKTMPQPIGDTDFVEAHKDYPPEARRLGVEGQVKVRLVVDAQGKVASRRLVTRLGHGLDQLAMRLARKLRFRPAIDTSDRPVPAVVVWTFSFTLPR